MTNQLVDSVPSHERRNLGSITADGVSFSVMVGLGETYIPAFVLAAGLGEVAAGLVATLPPLARASSASTARSRRTGSARRSAVRARGACSPICSSCPHP